jgi:hypothetical protein
MRIGVCTSVCAPGYEFTVEHDVDVQLTEGSDDLGEVSAERPLMTGLQGEPVWTAVGEAAEAVQFGSAAHAPGWLASRPSSLSAPSSRVQVSRRTAPGRRSAPAPGPSPENQAIRAYRAFETRIAATTFQASTRHFRASRCESAF